MGSYVCCKECGDQHPDWMEHVCNPERLEQYAVNRLRGQFAQTYQPRCRAPEGEAAALPLAHWRPFGEWLNTHPGQFAVYYADRSRH